MVRAGAEPSLHRRLMVALERGARAQQQSKELLAAHAALDAQVRLSIDRVRARRLSVQGARRRA